MNRGNRDVEVETCLLSGGGVLRVDPSQAQQIPGECGQRPADLVH
jgi:hypothetical protein